MVDSADFEGVTDEIAVGTITLFTSGPIDPTGDSGGDGAGSGIDEIAHETTPGPGTRAGTKEVDVGGECSRINNDSELRE